MILKAVDGRVIKPGDIVKLDKEYFIFEGSFESMDDVPVVPHSILYTIGDSLYRREVKVNWSLITRIKWKFKKIFGMKSVTPRSLFKLFNKIMR